MQAGAVPAPVEQPTAGRPPRIVGLDGIRALAAGLVLCYHLVPAWRGSGFVGVDMFFVLSGFLITSLLIREIALRKAIRFGRFWVRRIRRLMPAVIFATVGAVALARIAGGDPLVQMPWQVTGALTNTYNWFEIAQDAPYFGQRSPLLLTNFWSLAVEMQFYLVWPLVLALILRLTSTKVARWVALLGAAASAGWNFYLVHVADEVTRAYVGTDAHAFGLMLGAAVAFWVPRIMVEEQAPLARPKREIWGILSWLGLAGALAIGVFVPNGTWMYPWGMLAASVLTAFTVRGLLPDALTHTSRGLAWVLSTRPMVWFGERSYSIYLWHWPLWVIAFFTFRQASLWVGALVFVVSLVMADISYRFVETPIRTDGLKKWLSKTAHIPTGAKLFLSAIVVAALALFVLGIVTSPAKSSTEQLFDNAQLNEAPDVDASASLLPKEWEAAPLERFVEGKKQELEATKQAQAEEAAAAQKAAEEAAAAEPVKGDQVTFIGDSVTLMAQPQLEERLPGILINAEVSRPMLNFPTIAAEMDSWGGLREYVVIGLATNGFVRDEEIQAMFDAVGPDRKVVLVTGYGTPSEYWIFEANDEIRKIAPEHKDQIRIAEWEPIAASHHELLAGDLVHPDAEGAALYADEVVKALNSFK